MRNLIVAACMLAFVASGQQASARLQYLKAFKAAYASKLSGQKLTCAVCHPTKSKKDRNNYGAAVGKNVGMKNQKDEAKIKEALEKGGKEKSATDGKTFIDLINDGKLPGTKDVVK